MNFKYNALKGIDSDVILVVDSESEAQNSLRPRSIPKTNMTIKIVPEMTIWRGKIYRGQRVTYWRDSQFKIILYFFCAHMSLWIKFEWNLRIHAENSL